VRSEVLHTHRGQDQEAAVADDAAQVLAARGIGPAQPAVAGFQPPGRGTDGQATQDAVFFADDPVPDLRPAQRAGALGMMRPQHRVPVAAGRRPAGDRLQGHRSQIGQSAGEFWPDRRSGGGRPRRRRLASGRGQCDLAQTFQRQKLLAAGHLTRAARRVAQVQPDADLLRQTVARQGGILADAGVDPGQTVRAAQRLVRWDRCHAADATAWSFACPEVFVGKDQGLSRASVTARRTEISGKINYGCEDADARVRPEHDDGGYSLPK
jgi:hypothetical protein